MDSDFRNAAVSLLALLACALPASFGFAQTTSGDALHGLRDRRIWVASWADAPDSLGAPSRDQTFREIVKPSVGSRGIVRLHFSNFYGTTPVTLGAVHIAAQAGGASVSGDTPVFFAGAPSVTIPAGGFALSDEMRFPFAYGTVLAVTEYIPGGPQPLMRHNQAGSSVTSFASPAGSGDRTGDPSDASFPNPIFDTYLLDRVDVFGAYRQTVATFGSSTTDGLHSGLDTHTTYPEQLAAALHAAGHDDIAVANAGLSGNEVLKGGPEAGLARFARDVLALPGVGSVIDYLGANDLRNSCVPAASLIGGTQNLIAQAHGAGLKVYLATTAPSTFCKAQNPGGYGTRFPQGSGQEAQRTEVNGWDVSTVPTVVNGTSVQPPGADAVIDFSRALADPENTSYMLPAYDSGDDIHPNALGYAAMVRAIPLSLFLDKVPDPRPPAPVPLDRF